MKGTTDFPPAECMFPISSIEIRMEAGDHSLYAEHRDRIERHWQEEKAANPHLFNGPVVLQETVELSPDGRLLARGRMTPYATLLWWRRQPQDGRIRLLIGSAIPLSCGGAAMVIRMAKHTANAGLICLAAGSLDPSDVSEGLCDVLGSMKRELKEETGLDFADADVVPQLYAAHYAGRCGVFRFIRFPWSSDEMIRKVEAHMARESEPEIDGVFALTPENFAHYEAQLNGISRIALSFFFAGHEKSVG
ncbi:NUDIX hydrolase [Rhizobium helianthi]|uniref:NUDIX hydrolase n=1 Tax=Rhizobium helianthi TaxID=1132695 RepID=A0ABW4LXL5_9HYPH